MKKQTIREWLNEHTECGFDGVNVAASGGEHEVVSEYWDGTYQLCRDNRNMIWLANGDETVVADGMSDARERWPQDADEIAENLGFAE